MKCFVCGSDIVEEERGCWINDPIGGEVEYCFDCYCKSVNGDLDDRINHPC